MRPEIEAAISACLAAVRRRALLRDLGVRVSVSRPGPRRLVVEHIEIRALHAMV